MPHERQWLRSVACDWSMQMPPYHTDGRFSSGKMTWRVSAPGETTTRSGLEILNFRPSQLRADSHKPLAAPGSPSLYNLQPPPTCYSAPVNCWCWKVRRSLTLNHELQFDGIDVLLMQVIECSTLGVRTKKRIPLAHSSPWIRGGLCQTWVLWMRTTSPPPILWRGAPNFVFNEAALLRHFSQVSHLLVTKCLFCSRSLLSLQFTEWGLHLLRRSHLLPPSTSW